MHWFPALHYPPVPRPQPSSHKTTIGLGVRHGKTALALLFYLSFLLSLYLPLLCGVAAKNIRGKSLRWKTNRTRVGRWERVWRLEGVTELCDNEFELQAALDVNKAICNSNWTSKTRANFLWSDKSNIAHLSLRWDNTVLCWHVHVHNMCTQQHARGWTHAQILDPVQTCHKYHSSSFHNEVATLVPIALLMGHSLQGRCLSETESSCSFGL